jgi:predicted glycosyltransferase
LAAGVPSLVWPFAQNREQRLRAERLAALGGLTPITDRDLEPPRLAELMDETLTKPRDAVGPAVNLDGAQETASWLEAWLP